MDHQEPARKNKGDGDSDRRPLWGGGKMDGWAAGIRDRYQWSRVVFLFKIAKPLKF